MEHETIFDVDRGLIVKCKVCDIKCDTMIQFNIHQKSAKHVKKSQRLMLLRGEISSLSTSNSSQSSVTDGYQCQICRITCNTKEQLNVHFTGQAHKKKSLKIEYKNWDDAEIPLSQFSTKTVKNNDDGFAVECKMSPLQSPVKELIKPPFPMSISSTKNNLPDVINDLLIPEYSPNFIKCKLCNQSMNTAEQFSMHCNGTKHQRKLASMNASEMSLISKMRNLQINDDEFEYCDICQIRIHCNNMDSHCKGKIHKEKMVKMAHTTDAANNYPNKDHLSPECEHFDVLKLVPRKYQIEVYEKSLNKDCVIFLPTGTGKTLVATMIILKMLESNPYHRVAFLVDKVLLVMQQHDFFKEQFRDVCLERFDTDGKTSYRRLRLIGLANSYVNTEHATSVRDHDIVIATAELFRGLLSKRVLFWEEFGLVILDEAHHCTKDHPYNRLMREYQLYPEHVLVDKSDINAQLLTGVPKVYGDKLNDWKKRRCKIIGLTASPAGTLDKENTYTLLLELLESLGGVDIVNVIENKEELETYTSNSNIEAKLVSYSEKECKMREILKSSFFFMIGKFERFILVSKNLLVTKDCRSLSVSEVADFKSQLLSLCQDTLPVAKSTINHVMNILEIISAIDTYGYAHAWNNLTELLNNENEKVWIKDNIIRFMEEIQEFVDDHDDKESSVIQAIINEAKAVTGESRTILVLVKERETAHKFTKILKKECQDQKLVLLVGHGTGSSKNQKDSAGMSVSKQKKALNLIKDRNNQIIVATSVADEGIDLPDCDLVILVNPPSSVQALVQIRGRARKKSSRLLMMCRDQNSIDELAVLQVQERNIIDSIERILSQTRK